MKAVFQVLVLLALTALAATATQYLHPRHPAWYEVSEPAHNEDVTLQIIAQRWHNDVLWIDARPRTQFVVGHAPGAILINEQEADMALADHMEELATTKKPIVIYCSSESCDLARKMRDYIMHRVMQVEQIYVFRGGWKELEKHLGELEPPEK
jgi:3-mercaptopyruvate sulfurtransferase SseA